MNPFRLSIIVMVVSSFLGCQHQTTQEQPTVGIWDEETRQFLREYLSQPEYYQDQDFIE
ncbi:MAG: hypothetical protein SH848_12150 [Saprospiraceae bacterium]|nr:hypothetical protein [Saprospiraceae bacterium]MDZ4704677.1 hypothetical protein [Saprospiraceae bacterium]